MTFFPQIGSGSIAQFPVRRSRLWRPIANELESGERVLLDDSSANQIQWQLSMKDLSTTEASSITSIFEAAQGQYGAFLFVDPLANLLGWSEDLSQPDWQLGLLTAAPAAADPLGTTRASLLANTSEGAQALQQSLSIPGDYVACFSAWISSDAPVQVTIARDGLAVSAEAGPRWKRIYVSGKGSRGASESTFSLGLPAGQSARVWGLQVEAQPFPSQYKKTAAADGIYEETYFGSDELDMTSTAPGLFSCEVSLVSRG